MSMSSSFIYGYGFTCDCETEKLIEFAKLHKDTLCQSEGEKELYEKLVNCAKTEDEVEDLLGDYACDSTGIEGFGAIIANIMLRETGIRFIFCLADDECGTSASIVFETGYPWQFNEEEKDLTEETLHEICCRYMKELGISSSPNYLDLEYYG